MSIPSALEGSYGLQVKIANNNPLYVSDDRPVSEPRYQARFYFDPNSLLMAKNNSFFILSGYAAKMTKPVLQIEMQYANTGYKIMVSALNDSSTYVNTGWFPVSDARHIIALDWQAATSSGTNNGKLVLWIDGIQMASLVGIDNDTRRIDFVRLGAVTGIDKGTRGICYFDSFESRRQAMVIP